MTSGIREPPRNTKPPGPSCGRRSDQKKSKRACCWQCPASNFCWMASLWKAAQVGEAFKAALQNDAHIQVNEVCFVAADSAVAKSTMAAQLAARTLGFSPE